MSIFTGDAPPSVDTTKTTATTAPDYYTNYLSGLAGAANTAMNRSPDQMVAGFSNMQKDAFGNLPSVVNSYKPGLSAAAGTAAQGAQGITGESINNYLNPYTGAVVGEMGRLNQQNLEQTLLPNLKAGFVGTGAGGSSRNAGALAQFLAQNQANLTGQQAGELSKGFSTALGAAGQNAQIQNQAAQIQAAIAAQEQQLGLAGNKALQEAGAQQQALEQAKINAPLTTATNAAALLRNYNIPTSSTETYHGPWTIYQPSPLSQIAGLGTLLGGKDGLGKDILDALKGINLKQYLPFAEGGVVNEEQA